MLTALQLKDHRVKCLKMAIIKTAEKTLVNKPKLSAFKINKELHTDTCLSYESVNCIITESYTCPINKVKTVNKYNAVYDGVNLVMTQI
jgi:hypothetical protein